MKKSIIYTCQGDDGTTSLVGGQRVMKTDSRLEAYGTVDELSACLGYLASMIPDEMAENIRCVQSYLFTLSSILATPEGQSCLVFPADAVVWLEKEIDTIDSELPPLKSFILSGGASSAAYAHVCRTVCRRAERRILALASNYCIQREVVCFVNRLSDYLFVLARHLNKSAGVAEIKWPNACK